jgi:hypothetical protein
VIPWLDKLREKDQTHSRFLPDLLKLAKDPVETKKFVYDFEKKKKEYKVDLIYPWNRKHKRYTTRVDPYVGINTINSLEHFAMLVDYPKLRKTFPTQYLDSLTRTNQKFVENLLITCQNYYDFINKKFIAYNAHSQANDLIHQPHSSTSSHYIG